jgi:hypothetical protein
MRPRMASDMRVADHGPLRTQRHGTGQPAGQGRRRPAGQAGRRHSTAGFGQVAMAFPCRPDMRAAVAGREHLACKSNEEALGSVCAVMHHIPPERDVGFALNAGNAQVVETRWGRGMCMARRAERESAAVAMPREKRQEGLARQAHARLGASMPGSPAHWHPASASAGAGCRMRAWPGEASRADDAMRK